MHTIYIAGDNDHRREADGKPNVGREKAEEAAMAIGGFALLPGFAEQDAGSDWNDLARWRGPILRTGSSRVQLRSPSVSRWSGMSRQVDRAGQRPLS